MCINNKNAVIYNNYRKLQDFLLLFKISVDTRKYFLEIYRHFVHVPSKMFTSRGQILRVGFVNAVILKNRDIVVGIGTRLRAGLPRDCGSIVTRTFSVISSVQIGSEAHLACHSGCIGNFYGVEVG
jgi:hypothetical protein